MIDFSNRLFVLIVLLNFFSGCKGDAQKENANPEQREISLIKQESTISLPLDAETPNLSMGLAYYPSEPPMLFNLNPKTNSLQIFDLEEKVLYKTLTFEKEGQKGVGRVFGFHVHNLDSIFLFPQNKGEIYLTDTSGMLKSKVKYDVPLYHTAAFVMNSYFASLPVIEGGEMVVKTHVDGDHKAIKSAELAERSLTYSIDLNEGKVRLLPHHYPADYLSNGKRHFEASFAASPSRMVYSLFADHKLYYASSKGDSLKVKNAPSKYVKSDFGNYPIGSKRFESYQYFYASPHYGSLLYDPYRKVFYRFCYPKVEVENEEQALKLRRYPEGFSIMVLDEDLNILGETLFAKGKYYPNNAFITEEGLYLSINHADNPRNREDYLSFDLFGLEEAGN
ncbi:DUF4221 family protein [Echinicola shivajiensis]|uniref:DUF4221 family protein n=1 Tax=Echinicola shivajiensis TaxID=1035916 RepID=UPI001BFC92CB|nr:DUF4221 family protein [Echinicola shivajiensis]